MIFGGLEIVAGGYLAHRYYKNKNEKRRQEEDDQQRRSHTFPSSYPLQPHFQHQEQHLQHQRPQQATVPQKYACHAPIPPRPQCQTQTQPQQLRPKPSHAQSFNIPRRPLPQHKPEIIQPSLQRADSMATLSRMPIANGYRHTNDTEPPRPPRRQTNGLSPIQQSPYGNAAFSVSSPAFGASLTSPPVNYVVGHQESMGGHYMVDDNLETYEHGAQRYSAYAPTEASTQLGERDPPPPYAP
ncbi:hypothetical protein OPT61_g2318 [Boeremia exigua]|uniref:Uncharacterized protein n=1 Tax=Boeremia exigua TaxID=749465 RepID=A0ACC2ILY5_9PLEO|nr:hypothetical protein OPT61_g2318 [Boeremia exigua]